MAPASCGHAWAPQCLSQHLHFRGGSHEMPRFGSKRCELQHVAARDGINPSWLLLAISEVIQPFGSYGFYLPFFSSCCPQNFVEVCTLCGTRRWDLFSPRPGQTNTGNAAPQSPERYLGPASPPAKYPQPNGPPSDELVEAQPQPPGSGGRRLSGGGNTRL